MVSSRTSARDRFTGGVAADRPRVFRDGTLKMSDSSDSFSRSPIRTGAARNRSAPSSDIDNKERGGKTARQQATPTGNGEEISLLRRALTPGAYADWQKDEVLDVFWWLKQIVAVALGITLGAFRVTGWMGFLLFAVVQFLAANAWAERAQIVGVFIDHFDIVTENTLVALGTFLVRMKRQRQVDNAEEVQLAAFVLMGYLDAKLYFHR